MAKCSTLSFQDKKEGVAATKTCQNPKALSKLKRAKEKTAEETHMSNLLAVQEGQALCHITSNPLAPA